MCLSLALQQSELGERLKHKLEVGKRRSLACHYTLTTVKDSSNLAIPIAIFSFYRAGMECQRGLATKKMSVCLSVCLSVKRVDCDKTEERSLQIFYTIQKIT